MSLGPTQRRLRLLFKLLLRLRLLLVVEYARRWNKGDGNEKISDLLNQGKDGGGGQGGGNRYG